MLLSTKKPFFKKNVSNCNNTINDDKFKDVDFSFGKQFEKGMVR